MIYQMITTNMTNDYTNMSKTKSIKQQICVCSLKATRTHTHRLILLHIEPECVSAVCLLFI